jgi:hypothetical protein
VVGVAFEQPDRLGIELPLNQIAASSRFEGVERRSRRA